VVVEGDHCAFGVVELLAGGLPKTLDYITVQAQPQDLAASLNPNSFFHPCIFL